MKKCLLILLAAAFLLPLLAACGNKETAKDDLSLVSSPPPAAVLPAAPETSDDGVLEIKEKLFIAQCNDIYLNQESYSGKTVRIEGMYDEFIDEDGTIYRSVIRLGPGCCGNDGIAGFDFLCPDLPDCQQNDWISVEGIITPTVYNDMYETVIISNAKVTIKSERGAEFVSQ
jgi:uncharacterized membrane protein YcgQ (UPF0703/DUF1980 family)